ncbi:MAG: DUF3177 family protein [Merismopedia sp. SIO2A8]|nr:DUF3177 family protein [Symploca sp. SIO2B6]NET53893.1 DUF3177 family protein [Merismopedia sp. SIO2A8]
MSQDLLHSLVWMDYRLAIVFTVSLPLILLIWAVFQNMEAIQRLLIIYWRVSSLLAITVYLMIGGIRLGFLTALIARLLIPIALWFWVDLNEEIDDSSPSSLKLVFTAWRWAVSVYCVLGVIASVPFIRCTFLPELLGTEYCQVWQQAPWLYKAYFHSGQTPGFLGILGILGLGIYILYLAYFVLIRLGKQGRSAIQR